MSRTKMTARSTPAAKKKKDDSPVPFPSHDVVQPGPSVPRPFASTKVVTPATVVQHRAQAAMVVAHRKRELEKKKGKRFVLTRDQNRK